MAQSTPNSLARSNWVRLRTLIIIRWLAIAGQLGAVMGAVYVLNMAIPFKLCLAVITASVLFNLITGFILPFNKRLSERETILSLLFDLIQLVALLYLTGGLHNPFVLLILAPVTIAASALTLYATLILGFAALTMISALGFFYTPLTHTSGEILQLPDLFLWGMWVALVIGILFLAGYARRVTVEMFSMSQALSATQMALAREQQLTTLGGVVAAAAHEMGTPLATIKLAASELAADLKKEAGLHEDAILIQEQADRLSEILRDMGRNGKDDLLTKQAPLIEIVREAAEPHQNRGKDIVFLANGKPDAGLDEEVPIVSRHPEIIHGLRNLIQNAVDFSAKVVLIDVIWDERSLRIMIGDDGPGYPLDLLDRIGEPFISKRHRMDANQGMGLGLFIAKTLLERSGAELTFVNARMDKKSTKNVQSTLESHLKGAMVGVRWSREKLEINPTAARRALGQNTTLDMTA